MLCTEVDIRRLVVTSRRQGAHRGIHVDGNVLDERPFVLVLSLFCIDRSASLPGECSSRSRERRSLRSDSHQITRNCCLKWNYRPLNMQRSRSLRGEIAATPPSTMEFVFDASAEQKKRIISMTSRSAELFNQPMLPLSLVLTSTTNDSPSCTSLAVRPRQSRCFL